MQVKLANYTSAAAQSLSEQYGGSSWLTVVSSQGPLPTRTTTYYNRYYDAPSFYNGDRIFFDNNTNVKCTAGFAYVGNGSGITFTTTAGHCGGSSVWTNFTAHYEIASKISTNYFSSTSGWDMESYRCNCLYPVWYEGPSIGTSQGYTHDVAGTCYCGKGSYVTMDGATTGEVPSNYVAQVNICVTFNDGITTCHLNYAYNQQGKTICQGGDSGGPVYQRSSTNNVYATGLIVGTEAINDCLYQMIGPTLAELNGTLITG